MSKKKVLIIQNTIPHYRIPLYNELSKKYELTVLHSGNNRINENYKFNEIIASKRKIWPYLC